MKVLLINPNYRNIYKMVGSKSLTPIFPPFGLAYIAAVLRKNNINIKILEANVLDLTDEQIKEKIESYSPDIVGLTATTCTVPETYKIIKLCPKETTKILGGIHPSSMPEQTMKECPEIDILCIGEGEHTMLELAQKKPLNKIKGIMYKKNNKLIKTKPRPLIENLDELPFPARNLLPMEKYHSAGSKRQPADYLLSSRGCPYNCNFCADHLVHGKKFRYRSPENIIKEIEYLIQRGVKDIDFIDDNFTLLIDRAEKICDLMIEKGLNKKITWRCSNGVRIDRLNLNLLQKMKKAGCYMLSLGIESGNEQILKNIKKGITLPKVEEAVKMCKKAKIETRGLFMFGNLGENEQTMQDTINFAKKINTDTATFHITIPFPKTDYWNIINKEGKIFANEWKDYIAYGKVIFQHGALTPELLMKMQKKAYKEYYFRPKMIINQLKNLTSINGISKLIKGAVTVLNFQK